jgi:hypothetical protein
LGTAEGEVVGGRILQPELDQVRAAAGQSGFADLAQHLDEARRLFVLADRIEGWKKPTRSQR